MALKKFQTQDGFKLTAGAPIINQNNEILFAQDAQGQTTLTAGVEADSPWWVNTVNGSTLPRATILSVVAPEAAPPVITVTTTEIVIPDATEITIAGAQGMTGLNNNYWVKGTGNVNEYELYDDASLTNFTDRSGDTPYVEKSASLVYNNFMAMYISVAYDSQGNVLAAGTTSSLGASQVIVGKYSASGSVMWLKILGSEMYNLDGWGLAVDADNNAFVTVNNQTRILVLKIDGTNGDILWQTGITSPTGEYGYACELAADGNPVIAGSITNVFDLSTDFLVAKVSKSNGSLIWSKQIGANYDQAAYSLACDELGNTYVVGYTSDNGLNKLWMFKLDVNGDIVLGQQVQGYDDTYNITGVDTAFDSQHNIYISASGSVPDNGGSAAFLIKLMSDGSFAWARMIGPGNCATTSLSLCVDDQDQVFMSAMNGQSTTNVPQFDFVVGCYTIHGDRLWQSYWGSTQFWEGSGGPFTGVSGQMMDVRDGKMVMVGLLGLMDPNQYPTGNTAAFVTQLPSDGTRVNVGPFKMRQSNFTGQFITLNTQPFDFGITSNPLEQSTSDLEVVNSGYTSVSYKDWSTIQHEWQLKADGTMQMPGGVQLSNSGFEQDFFVGPEVYFVKTNYGDEIDTIDTDMEITRASQAGIFNIALEPYYDENNNSPAGTEWNGDGWSDLSNVTSRSYQSWKDAVYPPDDQLGQEYVMHDTVNDRYYTVKFLSWQSNANGGAFSYVRREINTSVFFRKEAYGDQVDYVDVGLSITRDSSGIIYNPQAGETGYDTNYSPVNTLWNGDGWNNLGNLRTRQWMSFYNIMAGDQVGKRVLGREWIMWDTNNDQYYAIEFSEWQPGNNGGAFSYTRRKINKAATSVGVEFPDGTVQKTAWNDNSAGILPQIKYEVSDDRWLNINDVGKHILFTQSGTNIYIPDMGSQPWQIGMTITIVNCSGGTIYLYKDNYDENGTIYGAGTSNYGTGWQIPDLGGGNICTLMCIERSGYDNPTVNWILSGPGIETD